MTSNQALKKIAGIIACAFAILFSSEVSLAGDEGVLKTVISEGVGSDLDSAAKKAAENALTQVVGEFIQVDKQISKSSALENGVKSESKKIDLNTREYSQGYIKSFRIKNSAEEEGQYKVRAEVIVRVDQFREFVSKKASGEVDITPEVYIGEQKNSENGKQAADIIINSIILPLYKGEAYKITPGKPVLYQSIEEKSKNSAPFQMHSEDIAIPVKSEINDAFLVNTTKILESISANKKNIPMRICRDPSALTQLFPDIDLEKDRIWVIAKESDNYRTPNAYFEDNKMGKAFLIKNYKPRENSADIAIVRKFKFGSKNTYTPMLPRSESYGYYHFGFPSLRVTLVSKDGRDDEELIIDSAMLTDNYPYHVGVTDTWNLLKLRSPQDPYCVTIFMKKNLYVLMPKPLEDLSQMSKIKFDLQDK